MDNRNDNRNNEILIVNRYMIESFIIMAMSTAKATTVSSENNNDDIECGGGNGSIGSTTTVTPPTLSMTPPNELPVPVPNEQTKLLPGITVTSLTTKTDDETTANDENTNSTTKDVVEGSNATTASAAAANTEAIPASSMRQTAMSGFAGVGFVTSLVSMMAEYSATAIQHPAIVVSGCLGLILSPYAKFQQEKLTQVKALEQTNSVLEDELKYLQQEHEKITKHVETVNASTTKLRSLQATLSNVQSANIQSIDQLEQQVQQSKEILSQFQQNTQAMILQNLITVLVNCDRDHTMTLDDNEIDKLIKSLESMHNVQFNDAKIRQLILNNQRSVTAIMEIARNLIDNTSSSTSVSMVPPNNATTADGANNNTTKSTATTTTSSTSVDTTQPPGTAFEKETIFSYMEN